MRPPFRWLVCAAIPVTAAPLAAQRAADSTVYVLAPAPTSRFEVQTGSAGLFAFAGHDHLIRARALEGEVVVRAGNLADARVRIVIRADGLEVLTPPDTAEIRKVTAAMRGDVLEVSRYPEIRFVSTAVTPRPQGLEIRGELTIHGVTRPVVVEARTTITDDTLRAAGSFRVKQTNFGIRPTRAGPAGVVKVADRIELRFAAVAVRAPAPE